MVQPAGEAATPEPVVAFRPAVGSGPRKAMEDFGPTLAMLLLGAAIVGAVVVTGCLGLNRRMS